MKREPAGCASFTLPGASSANNTLPITLPVRALPYQNQDNLPLSPAAILQLLRSQVPDKANNLQYQVHPSILASHPAPLLPQSIGAMVASANKPNPATAQGHHGKQSLPLRVKAGGSLFVVKSVNSIKSSQAFKTVNPRETFLKASKPKATNDMSTSTTSAPMTGLQQSLLIGNQKPTGSKEKMAPPDRTFRKGSLGVARKRPKGGTNLQSNSIQQYFEARKGPVGYTESQTGITLICGLL